MKTISIIGIGMSPETVTAQGLRAIKNAQMLLGAKRMVDDFAVLGKPSVAEYSPAKVKEAIDASDFERFAVLVSGDVGFYSAAAGLRAALCEYDVKLIPGISSMVYFYSKLGMPWQDAAAISSHGRTANFVDTVRRNANTFSLTGGNVNELAQQLCDAGYGELQVNVGENLGLPNERILTCSAQELCDEEIASLAVINVINLDPDDRCPTGIADEAFTRGNVPMTKSEIRAAVAAKLNIKPTDICADLGAGTGSVTVEMALSAWKGHVYACDKNEEAVSLIRENCRKFHVGNVSAEFGDNLEYLKTIPAVDVAFIGGSGGEMTELVAQLREKNPDVRIVITAIAIESVTAAVEALKSAGLEPDIVQLNVSRGKKAGSLHLMMAQNPIYIISGGM